LSDEEFSALNELAFKLEDGLLRLVENLERKKLNGEWSDSLIVKESNENYLQYSENPILQHSSTPTLQR
jgi:hypothetical protein